MVWAMREVGTMGMVLARTAAFRPAGQRARLVAATLLAVCAAPALAGEAPPAKTESPAAEKPSERLPIPVGSWVADAEKQLKDSLKDEYQKKGAVERTALARRLLKLAQENRKELLTCYIALREARDVGVSAGDFETAFAAIDLLAETFEVDAAESKASALLTIARNLTTADAAEGVFHAGMELLDRLRKGAQLETAVKLLSPLEDLARRANNPELLKTVQARAKDVRARQAEWAKAKPHVEKLAAEPDDADAAAAVAKYHVASEGDWERALPLFARCSAPALKEAATKDLAKPEEAAAQAEAGDRWWSLSERETGSLKAALQRRAAAWYNQALEGLSGPRKAQAEKRIQAAAGIAGSAGEWLKTAGLVFWVNPGSDPAGKARDLISNAPPTNTGAVPVVTDAGLKALKFESSYVTYPATDAVRAIKGAGSFFLWIKHEKSIEAYASAIFRGAAPGPQVGKGYADFSLFLHQDRLMLWFNWPESTWPGTDGKTAFFSKRALTPGKWTMCGAAWDGTTIAIYVNGERDNTYKSAATPLKRSGPDDVVLGCDPAGSPEYYSGLMSCAMIFNRALTDPEAKQLYLMYAHQGR
jgi:hypothetical protein